MTTTIPDFQAYKGREHLFEIIVYFLGKIKTL